jgi:ubiquitin C-terminal hydrolase
VIHAVFQVTDYNSQWETVRRRLQLDSDFIHFVELCGTPQAEKEFRRHVIRLRDEFVRHRQSLHLSRLEMILRQVLPDLSTIAERFVQTLGILLYCICICSFTIRM